MKFSIQPSLDKYGQTKWKRNAVVSHDVIFQMTSSATISLQFLPDVRQLG